MLHGLTDRFHFFLKYTKCVMMAIDKAADIACSAITIDEASIAIALQAIYAEISIAAIMHDLISRVL
jgi:hypothetical protein